MVLENLIGNLYLRIFIEFLLFLFVLKVSFFGLEKLILKLTLKTKTDLDDLIVKKSSKPLNLIIVLLSIRLVISTDFLSEPVFNTLSSMLFSIIVITLGYLAYALIDIFLVRAAKRFASKTKNKVDDNLISLSNGVLKIALVVIVLLYILSLWGVEILPLIGALGVAGLAVALALQPTLSNIFSGASIIIDKTVSKGDLIYLDQNTKGKIDKIGLRSTKILTFDNELIIVPNSKLAESIIQNVALPEPKSRVVIPFGVVYGSNIEKVKKIVLNEINSVKNIVKDTKPLVRFLEMSDSSLDFKAYFYVDSYLNRFNAIDEANTKIYNALNKNKIGIPFPQLDVHIKK